MNKEFHFTSESVTEGHPDKVCDCISDAILDGIFKKDKDARVACETMASSNKIIISGEITTNQNLEKSFYSDIAREVLNDIGYSNDKVGMNGKKVDIEVKDFLKRNMYNHKNVIINTNRGKKIIKDLFNYLSRNPKKYIREEVLKKEQKERAITDFIAGMTDRYAINLHKKIK